MRTRFDLVEVSLFVGLAALVTFSATKASSKPPPSWFEQRYGKPHYSSNEEELIIRDFFEDKRDGVFVDVGANHHERGSNTYYLERELGWSGLAIDPIDTFADGYREFRPRTRFFTYFVADRSGDTDTLFIPDENNLVSSSSRAFVDREEPGQSVRTATVPTITLNDLLQQEGISRIDLLSVDVELAEPKALAGFDIDRFRPALVCIEGHLEVRQQILDYFARHGYVVIGRYLRSDTVNLYFRPLQPGPA